MRNRYLLMLLLAPALMAQEATVPAVDDTDGQRAAFAAGGAVRVLDLATGEERRVADAKAGAPPFSADGSALLYRVAGNRREIQARNAVISAEGEWVAFESNYGEGAVPQVWLVRPDGSGLQQFTFGAEPASGPSLSAAGDLLAWVQGGRAWVARTVLSGDGSRAALTAGASVYTVDARLTIE